MAMASEVLRPARVEIAEPSSSGSPELHVLAVDDNHVDRKFIERLLRISSCKVTVVDSGTRALQYLGLDVEKGSTGYEGLTVNLIMTDYSMPGMTGYELLKKIKESSVLREIPVVIMSSENILPRIDRCLEEGAEDFLLKPVKLSDVKRLRDCVMKGESDQRKSTRLLKRRMESEIIDPLHPAASLLGQQATAVQPHHHLPPSSMMISSSPLVPLCSPTKRAKVQLGE